ncbi:Membrane protein [Chlamydiales bacterium STE3]|nr:Membrane protein [Chlamydiales bacterium STE3]
MELFPYYVVVGFIAQIVDGALGMAYGLISTTLLLSLGFSPLSASTTTHAAECFTTAFSGIAHHQFGNINRRLLMRLLIPGILGAAIGAYSLSVLDGDKIKPLIALYLMTMGIVIIAKGFREFPPKFVVQHLIPLGFFGALIDTLGGGGWGPIVSSTLLARGHDARTTIGSVNACEFFVVITASLTFFLSGSLVGWDIVFGLALGGAVAAPFGAWLCKHMSHKYLLFIVGALIIGLSLKTFWDSLLPFFFEIP